jgi:hypothetical protein
MGQKLWDIYLSENITGMVTAMGYLSAFFFAVAFVYIVKNKWGWVQFSLICGSILGCIAVLTPKERFIVEAIERTSCEQILKTEVAAIVKEVPKTVERTIKAEAAKLPKVIEKTVEQEIDELGDRMVRECKLF